MTDTSDEERKLEHLDETIAEARREADEVLQDRPSAGGPFVEDEDDDVQPPG